MGRPAVEYIERLLNRGPLHCSLGYQSRIEFEKTLKTEVGDLPSSEPFVGRSRKFATDERVEEKADFDMPLSVRTAYRVAVFPYANSLFAQEKMAEENLLPQRRGSR